MLQMDITAAIRHLESLGLYVARHVPGGMTDRSSTDGLTVARARVPLDWFHRLEEVCYIFPIRERWCYRNWNGIGGRAPDDVHIEDLTLRTAVQYAEAYYFGEPLILDDWCFPVNQHPDWDIEQIRSAFQDALTVTYTDWLTLRHDRHVASKEWLQGDDRFCARFREIHSVRPRDDLRLWVRNDIKEMYFVLS